MVTCSKPIHWVPCGSTPDPSCLPLSGHQPARNTPNYAGTDWRDVTMRVYGYGCGSSSRGGVGKLNKCTLHFHCKAEQKVGRLLMLTVLMGCLFETTVLAANVPVASTAGCMLRKRALSPLRTTDNVGVRYPSQMEADSSGRRSCMAAPSSDSKGLQERLPERRIEVASGVLRMTGGWWGGGADACGMPGAGANSEAASAALRTLATTGHTHMSFYGFMFDLRATSLPFPCNLPFCMFYPPPPPLIPPPCCLPICD